MRRNPKFNNHFANRGNWYSRFIGLLLILAITFANNNWQALAQTKGNPNQKNRISPGENKGQSLFGKKTQDEIDKAKQISLEFLSQNPKLQGLDVNDSLTVLKVEIDDLGMAHTKVRQVVNNIPVWEGDAIVHLRGDGSLATITDNLKTDVSVNTEPNLTAQEAIEAAMKMYEGSAFLTQEPTADLWIFRGEDRDHLVYRVRMHREDGTEKTAMPVIFVDAQNGQKVFSYNNLQTGTGSSLYSGTVNISTSSNTGQQTYYMEDLTRKQGTFNMNNTGNTSTGTGGTQSPYTDSDDNWNSTTQQAGVDAHYGAAKTLDYFQTVHGRNGIDGNYGPGTTTSSVNGIPLLVSRVHFGTNFNNAFWNGSNMTYGDGDGTTFSPLVTLDIAGHEMTHGLTERTANLTYARESGALNESMSDVFGAMVELYTRGGAPTAETWKIGEQAYTPNIPGDALRRMDNPNAAGDPDHYSLRVSPDPCTPSDQNDQCGVHTNSSIANHAFYLLAAGGTNRISGINVTGIGTTDSAKIWFRALTFYMTASTNFAGARTATLSAATDLFGANSTQYNATAKAWCAVGVGACTSNCTSTPIAVGQTINGTLATSDCVFSGTTRYLDSYTFSGTNGQQIAISMNSTAVDTYLYLLNSAGTTIAENDDIVTGTNTNSRIPTTGFFTLPSTGNFTILATSYNPNEVGAYTINLAGTAVAGNVQFSSATYSVNENGGTAAITVTRTGGTSAFNVNYATSNGTATAGQDYTAANGTLNFADGETSKTFNVSIIDDTAVEGNETVNLTLSNPTGGATIGTPGTAVLTIIDNDAACTYQVNPTSRNVSQAAGSNSVSVVTQAGCAWTATVNAPGLADSNFLTQTPDLFTLPQNQSSSEMAPNAVFSNNSPVTINDRTSNTGPPGTGSLYPSNITVSGLTGTVTQVKVTLNGLTHTFPDDMDILLVGPGGQRALLMSDAGGGASLTGVNVTFDQSAANTVPDNSQITTGTYRPGNYAGNTSIEPGGVDNFPTPGPGQTTYNPDLSVFNGTSANGVWQLYTVDDENVDSGSIATGWSLDITTSGGGGGSWITLSQPASGNGAGTITYNYTANNGAGSRNGQILINGTVVHTVTQAGSTTTVTRKPFDYDGDGKTDLSVFRPSNGQWWINWSSNNSSKVYQFGQTGDSIVPADYTGDGKTDVAIWRNGTWSILRSENDTFYAAPFGTTGDIPVPGDFDADGRADLAVFRPTAATWFILGTTQGSIIRQWGANGDVPVVGDYDGDNRADLAIFRPSDGSWWVQRSTAGNLVVVFGTGTDKPVPADYTGDGKTDVAFWRPTTGTWFVLRSEDLSFYAAPFGANGDIPAPGDYDGDNRADLAVFRPTAATWFILRSTQGSLFVGFGANGDRPTPSAYIP